MKARVRDAHNGALPAGTLFGGRYVVSLPDHRQLIGPPCQPPVSPSIQNLPSPPLPRFSERLLSATYCTTTANGLAIRFPLPVVPLTDVPRRRLTPTRPTGRGDANRYRPECSTHGPRLFGVFRTTDIMDRAH